MRSYTFPTSVRVTIVSTRKVSFGEWETYRCMKFSFGRGFHWTPSSLFGVNTSVYIVWSPCLLWYLDMSLADGRRSMVISERRTPSADFGGISLIPLQSYHRFSIVGLWFSPYWFNSCMFSTFWHQLFRAAFIANASLIARILVPIPKGGPVYRGVITFLIFCLAASVHAVGLWTGRPTCDVIPITIRKSSECFGPRCTPREWSGCRNLSFANFNGRRSTSC